MNQPQGWPSDEQAAPLLDKLVAAAADAWPREMLIEVCRRLLRSGRDLCTQWAAQPATAAPAINTSAQVHAETQRLQTLARELAEALKTSPLTAGEHPLAPWIGSVANIVNNRPGHFGREQRTHLVELLEGFAADCSAALRATRKELEADSVPMLDLPGRGRRPDRRPMALASLVLWELEALGIEVDRGSNKGSAADVLEAFLWILRQAQPEALGWLRVGPPDNPTKDARHQANFLVREWLQAHPRSPDGEGHLA